MELIQKNQKNNNIKYNTLEGILGYISAGISTTYAYIASANIATNTNFSDETDAIITGGLMATSAIIGYKIPAAFKRVKRRIKKSIKRNKILSEISKDEDFKERMGIKEALNTNISKKTLNYAFTVPFGGALGYIPGLIGVTPLCFYFSMDEKFNSIYDWENPAMFSSSGHIAGSLVGAFAYGEMTKKIKIKK